MVATLPRLIFRWRVKEYTGTGGMLAWYPPPALAERLAVPDGEKVEHLHLTLAFFKDATAIDQQALIDVLEEITSLTPPLTGTLNGVGRFTATDSSDGKDVCYLNADVPGLVELRMRLVDRLAERGIAASNDHGFTPHMTLAYVMPDQPLPLTRLEPEPITIDTVHFVMKETLHTAVLTGTGQVAYKYSEDQPRDESGKWTDGGGDGGGGNKYTAAEGLMHDGTYRVYHGTTVDRVDVIRENGLKNPQGTSQRWYMTATNVEEAAGYSKGQIGNRPDSDARVIEYRIPTDRVGEFLGKPQESNVYTEGANHNQGLKQTLPGEFINAVHTVSGKARKTYPFNSQRTRAEQLYRARALNGLKRVQTNAINRKMNVDEKFWVTQKGVLKEALGTLPQRTLLTGITQASQMGVVFDSKLVHKHALELIPEYLEVWLDEITGTSSKQIMDMAEALQQYVIEGDMKSLTAQLEPVFGETRADMIAATEVTRLYSMGNDAAFADSGVVTGWEWMTAEDADVDPDCEEYSDGGPYDIGDGPEMPAHPRCRCWKRPVVPEGVFAVDEEPEE